MTDPENTVAQTPNAITLYRDTVDSILAALKDCQDIPNQVSERLDAHAESVERRARDTLLPFHEQLTKILEAIEQGFAQNAQRGDAHEDRITLTEADVAQLKQDVAELQAQFRDFAARHSDTEPPPPASSIPG